MSVSHARSKHRAPHRGAFLGPFVFGANHNALFKKKSCQGFLFRAPKWGNLTNRIIQKTHKTLAAFTQAEASSICSTISAVRKEKTVVSVRDRFRVERTALGIAGGQNKVVEAAQDEASPTPLPVEPPKAKNLLLGEGRSLLRAHFPRAQEPGRCHPRDGRAKTVAAGRELAERADDRPTTACASGPSRAPYSRSLASIGPTVPLGVPWSCWSRERAFDKYCSGTSAARCSINF